MTYGTPAIQESIQVMIKLLLTVLILLGLPFAFASNNFLKSKTTQVRGGNQVIATAAKGPLQTFLATVHDARQHLVAAAVARGTCTALMYPLDVFKTRIQIDHPNPFNLKGLFDGVGGSLLGQVPYGVLTFGSYEVYKKKLRERFPDINPAISYALAAVGGDITGSILLCPSEVIKSQGALLYHDCSVLKLFALITFFNSQVQAGIFKTSRQAFQSILNTKGVAGLYQGFLGLAARDIPFRVCQLTSYEIVKSLYLKSKTTKQQADVASLTPIESAVCGAIAGTFSAAVTTPLDRIKTLVAIDGGKSVTGCVSMILAEEGPFGLMRGLWPRISYVAPSVTIFFIVYEATQQHLKK